MSMSQTYNRTDDSSVTLGQTYSKGDDSAISVIHSYKGDNYNLSVGPSYSRGESTIISFGGYDDDDDLNPSGYIISSYNLLTGQSFFQRSNAPSEKELVQSNNVIVSGVEVSRKKDEPGTSKKLLRITSHQMLDVCCQPVCLMEFLLNILHGHRRRSFVV